MYSVQFQKFSTLSSKKYKFCPKKESSKIINLLYMHFTSNFLLFPNFQNFPFFFKIPKFWWKKKDFLKKKIRFNQLSTAILLEKLSMSKNVKSARF